MLAGEKEEVAESDGGRVQAPCGPCAPEDWLGRTGGRQCVCRVLFVRAAPEEHREKGLERACRAVVRVGLAGRVLVEHGP